MNADSFARWDSLTQTGLESASKNWGWVLASGIAFVMLGALALAFSVMTTLASVFVLGWILAFAGIFEAVHAFKLPRWSGVLPELLAAILYVVVGVLMIVRPAAGALSLTLLVGAFFLVGGIFRIVAATVMRPPNWGWLLVSGIVTLLLGLLIVAAWPASGLWVIGMFVGIDLLFSGTSLTMFAFGLRNLASASRDTSVGSPGTFEGRPAHQPGS
jgi:uncharacterized membrane protein HdeD (DUF308 family)